MALHKTPRGELLAAAIAAQAHIQARHDLADEPFLRFRPPRDGLFLRYAPLLVEGMFTNHAAVYHQRLGVAGGSVFRRGRESGVTSAARRPTLDRGRAFFLRVTFVGVMGDNHPALAITGRNYVVLRIDVALLSSYCDSIDSVRGLKD
jgi:hypothetical protein